MHDEVVIRDEMRKLARKVLSISEAFLLWIVMFPVKSLFLLIEVLMWIPSIVRISFEKSCFPEKKRKRLLVRLWDNLIWLLLHQRGNEEYNLYGLDLKGRSAKPYLDQKTFWKGLSYVAAIGTPTSQVPLLRDKFLFYKYMKSTGNQVPEVFALIKNGRVFDNTFQERGWDYLEGKTEYFLKSIDGCCASFVKRIHSYEDVIKYRETLKTGSFICQEPVIQCAAMNKLNPGSINTLRVTTVCNQRGEPYVLSGILRIGTKKTDCVDNWAVGGIIVGIEPNGRLKEYGFYKPGFGDKTCIHPDTGIRFADFSIPKYEDVLKSCCEAHKSFYNLGCIGWDVCITEYGPVFIEGNDDGELWSYQVFDRPLRDEWNKLVREFTK